MRLNVFDPLGNQRLVLQGRSAVVFLLSCRSLSVFARRRRREVKVEAGSTMWLSILSLALSSANRLSRPMTSPAETEYLDISSPAASNTRCDPPAQLAEFQRDKNRAKISTNGRIAAANRGPAFRMSPLSARPYFFCASS
jgi:hypothetical protein